LDIPKQWLKMLVDIWKTGLSLLNYSKYYEVVVLCFPLYRNKKHDCFKNTRFHCQYVWRNPSKTQTFVPNTQNHHVSEPGKIKTQKITNKLFQRFHPISPQKRKKQNLNC